MAFRATKYPARQLGSIFCFFQGSEQRLVLPAILGECRAWREIQNLYMRFVDPKREVSAPMYLLFQGVHFKSYSAFAWILGLTNLAE